MDSKVPSFVAKAKKAVVAALGTGCIVIATVLQFTNVLPDQVAQWAQIVLACGTVLGVYSAKNAQPQD